MSASLPDTPPGKMRNCQPASARLLDGGLVGAQHGDPGAAFGSERRDLDDLLRPGRHRQQDGKHGDQNDRKARAAA